MTTYHRFINFGFPASKSGTFLTFQQNRVLVALVGGLLLVGFAAHAAQLVYFDEVAAGQSPRALYNFDTITGISTLRTMVPGQERFFAMDMRPTDGTVFAISLEPTPGLFTINIDTGASSLVGLTGVYDLVGLAFSPATGQLFGLKNNGGLYTIHQTTGAATLIGSTAFPGGYVDRGLVSSPSGQLFGFTHAGALYRIDAATGSVTAVGGTGNPVSLLSEDAVFTSTGQLFATDYAGVIFQTDPLTGNGVVLNSTGAGSGLLAIFTVPEPSPAALGICATGLLVMYFRRKASACQYDGSAAQSGRREDCPPGSHAIRLRFTSARQA